MAANDWSERTKLIVTVAVAVALNVAVLGYLYTVYQDYQGLQRTRAANAANIQKLRKETDTLEEEQVKLDTKEKEVATKMKKLPENADPAKMIEDISKIAGKYGCIFKSCTTAKGITPESSQGGGKYYKDVYHYSYEADFFAWCQLMNELEENFDMFVSFDHLMLTPKNSGVAATGIKHQITADMIMYRFVPDKPDSDE